MFQTTNQVILNWDMTYPPSNPASLDLFIVEYEIP